MTETRMPYAGGVPTGPLKSLQRNFDPAPAETNPLSSYFRKKKLSLMLPSKGQWYPENSLNLDTSGGLPVFSMNSGDDIKFRAGDVSLTGRTTYELIRSCIPGILKPESIPSIDIDTILLVIRLASYGDDFDFTCSVPNTTLTRTIKISLTELLKGINERPEKWDDEITIEDETGQTLSLIMQPIALTHIFSTSKSIYTQKKALNKNIDEDENVKDEKVFSDSILQLTNTAIDLICSSIKQIRITDSNGKVILDLTSNTPQDSLQILEIIKNLDIEYFNAIRDHLESQRKKYSYRTPMQTSTEKELKSGATKEWDTEITFMGSSFLPSKNII